jgi:hypothetical protein
MQKVAMWRVGNRNIPHVGQDTNVTMESFHNNTKQSFFLVKNNLLDVEWIG